MLGTQKRPAATAAPVPSPAEPIHRLEDHDGYREAVAKEQDVRRELQQVRSRLAAIRLQTRDGEASLHAQARALLDGAGQISNAIVLAAGEHGELLRRERLLEMALKMANERVQVEMRNAHREIATAAKPEYRAILERMARALVEVGKIADEEAALRDRVNRATPFPSGALQTLPFAELYLSVEGSKINRWLDEARDVYSIEVKARRADGTFGIHGHDPRNYGARD